MRRRETILAREIPGVKSNSRPLNSEARGLKEIRQVGFELRRAVVAAAKLAALLELAGRREDYEATRALERRLLADLVAVDEALGAHE